MLAPTPFYRTILMTLYGTGAARTGAVEGHQNGAIEGSRRSIDELCYFFLALMVGRR